MVTPDKRDRTGCEPHCHRVRRMSALRDRFRVPLQKGAFGQRPPQTLEKIKNPAAAGSRERYHVGKWQRGCGLGRTFCRKNGAARGQSHFGSYKILRDKIAWHVLVTGGAEPSLVNRRLLSATALEHARRALKQGAFPLLGHRRMNPEPARQLGGGRLAPRGALATVRNEPLPPCQICLLTRRPTKAGDSARLRLLVRSSRPLTMSTRKGSRQRRAGSLRCLAG